MLFDFPFRRKTKFEVDPPPRNSLDSLAPAVIFDQMGWIW